MEATTARTGGRSGTGVLAAVNSSPAKDAVDWRRLDLWWSDERFVPVGHQDRNDRQSREALLDSIPTAHVHSAAGSDAGIDVDAAADAYAAELARYGTDDQPWPSFDVCFLGVGPDGHIASLFPDRPEILIVDRAVVAFVAAREVADHPRRIVGQLDRHPLAQAHVCGLVDHRHSPVADHLLDPVLACDDVTGRQVSRSVRLWLGAQRLNGCTDRALNCLGVGQDATARIARSVRL